MLILEILIVLLLSVILIQDMLTRSVYWIVFPILALLFVVLRYLPAHRLTDLWQPALINAGFVSLIFLLLTAYFSAKKKKLVNITNEHIGLADLLFLLAIAFYLSVLNFFFFYITSLSLVLLFVLIGQKTSKIKYAQIPLAGLQALIFILFLATDWWFGLINLNNDAWLLNLIYK